ncbi:MAG: DUF61 family protein [Candidatus Hodarchaeales archaeon]|jgi:uncharacterized protein (UPF0216 family)
MSRKLIEGLWNAEKAKLIAALPKVKIPLKQLIDKPEFLLNDGEVSAVASSDLELLCKIIPEPLWEEFMLPIIFQKRKQLYRILGGKTDHWVVETVLELTAASPFFLDAFSPRKYFYVYHYRTVQTRIPTVTFLTFAVEGK